MTPPPSETSAVNAARELALASRWDDAWTALRPLLLTSDNTSVWNAARRIIDLGAGAGWRPTCQRELRVAILCTYDVAELAAHFELASLAMRIDPQMYCAPFGQLEQEALDRESGLARFRADYVVVAPTTADLGFSERAKDPEQELTAEAVRWEKLWAALAERSARIVQHAFVVPDETPLGHLSLRMPGSRLSLVRELNQRLGGVAGQDVLLVDCERIAARFGKDQWFDPRMWYAARRPYAQGVVPALARETAAVLAGDVGLAARCVVVDLDNTLWGGIVGDDGPDGVVVGDGPEGEAYSAFQEYLRSLKDRGVMLAVASKNDADAARAPFEHNPNMRLQLADFAFFVADWRRKPEQITDIAEQLGLDLEMLVFVDDNPAECAEVAAALPAVDTIPLGVSPSDFVRRFSRSVRFELPSLTAEDLARQRSYAGRARAEELRRAADSLPDFWRSLDMRARVGGITANSIDRVAQLTQKTNQFNLTLVRRSRDELQHICDNPGTIGRTLELEDRFARHGVVGVAIAVPDHEEPTVAVIDTLVLSCRVIGRTAENHLLSHVVSAARSAGFEKLRGFYTPGPRNGLVADLYTRLGFTVSNEAWEYDLKNGQTIASDYIEDLA